MDLPSLQISPRHSTNITNTRNIGSPTHRYSLPSGYYSYNTVDTTVFFPLDTVLNLDTFLPYRYYSYHRCCSLLWILFLLKILIFYLNAVLLLDTVLILYAVLPHGYLSFSRYWSSIWIRFLHRILDLLPGYCSSP